MNFPREYLALVALFAWAAALGGFALGYEWLYNRQERRERDAATAAQGSHSKSA